MIRTQMETARLKLRLFTHKEYWGRGIGTEATKACVDFARDDLNIKKLDALQYEMTL